MATSARPKPAGTVREKSAASKRSEEEEEGEEEEEEEEEEGEGGAFAALLEASVPVASAAATREGLQKMVVVERGEV